MTVRKYNLKTEIDKTNEENLKVIKADFDQKEAEANIDESEIDFVELGLMYAKKYSKAMEELAK